MSTQEPSTHLKVSEWRTVADGRSKTDLNKIKHIKKCTFSPSTFTKGKMEKMFVFFSNIMWPNISRWCSPPSSRSTREQPIFTTRAHVFQIDPTTKRNWIPASKHAVSVSFFYDANRNVYRIISVGGTKVRV